MQRSLMVAGLALLLLTVVTSAQDTPPAGKAATPAKFEKSSPEVVAILDAAIKRQGPKKYAKDGAIRDFTLRISSKIWDHNVSPPGKMSVDVLRILVFAPEEKFRTEWKTTAGIQVRGFDGKRFWYGEYDQNGKLIDSRFLLGDKWKEDRQKIREEIDETRYLLRLFFLANMRGPEVTFTAKKPQTIQIGRKAYVCDVLYRENHAAQSTEPPLTLCIDKKTSVLIKATAHATRVRQKSLSFLMRYNEILQPRVNGVLFPFRIETREKPWGAEKDRISTEATLLDEKGIAFNTSPPAVTFRRPK